MEWAAIGRRVQSSYLVGVIVALSLNLSAHAEGDPVVYLRQIIKANYQQNSEILKSDNLTKFMSRTTTVQQNDTLSSIISRHYGVGVSNAGAAYSALESSILASNKIASPTALRANSRIKIPDLPFIAATSPNNLNTYDRVPKISIGCEMPGPDGGTATQLCRSLSALTDPEPQIIKPVGASTSSFVFDQWRKGAQATVQIRPTTLSEALRLMKSAPNGYEVESAPLLVRLAQAPASVVQPAMPASDVALIQRALAGAPHRHPIVVILDDSWPDDASFIAAKNFFTKAITELRASKRMGPPRFSKTLMNATTAPFTAPQTAGTNNAISAAHAPKIERSLAPLLSLDAVSNRVEVIYLPLSIVQTFASEILENLVAVNIIGKTLGPTLDNPLDDVPQDVQKTSYAEAHAFVEQTATVLGETVQTDQAVVEAVLNFARLYASFPDRPIFVNMSWTVPNLQLSVVIPDDAYGLDIVAAGNECPGGLCHTSVYDIKRQFAYRSLTPPGDVLAVMSLGPDGSPVCDSSLLDVTNDIVGVGFDGTLSATECGTSFAAPRVAWLLAAREAMTDAADTQDHWKSSLHVELTTKLHDPTAANFNKIRLRVAQLFSGFLQH